MDKEGLALFEEWEKRQGRSKLTYLSREILGYPDVTEKLHKEMELFIKNPAAKNKLGLYPRKHLKTTVGTVSYCIQEILNNPNIRICIIANTWDNARKILGEIRGHLERNEHFISLYGNYIGSPWNNDEITVNKKTAAHKEPTIMTAGLEKSITSLHFDLIICEDLVDPENIKTQLQVQSIITYFNQLWDILVKEGRLLMWGTRHSWHDLYSWIMDDMGKEQGWKLEKIDEKLSKKGTFLITVRAITEGGKFIYPRKFDEEVLADLRAQKGTYETSMQYYNNPVPDKERTFKENWIKFYTDETLPKGLHYNFVTVDPASSQKKWSDYTGSIITSVFPPPPDKKLGKIYVRYAKMEKLNPKQRIDKYYAMYKKMRPKRFGIENVGFQETDRFYFEKALREQKINFTPEALKAKQVNKIKRIEGLQPYFERGDVFIKHDQDDLLRQLEDFPKCRFFDLLDALAYQLQIIFYPPRIETQSVEEFIQPDIVTAKMLDQHRKMMEQFREEIPLALSDEFSDQQVSDYVDSHRNELC